MTTLTDYLIKVSEDKEENRKFMEDHEAALAASGLSEEHKRLLRESKENRDKIRAAVIAETPGATVMSSFMIAHVVKRHHAPGSPDDPRLKHDPN